MKTKNYDWLAKLRCPRCAHAPLKRMPKRKGSWGAWGVPGLTCSKCRERYPVEAPGILRLIPRGDYSRYAYWEKMHSQTSPAEITALYKRRFQYSPSFLLKYYAMPRLALRLGWKGEDSVELGSQWGSNSLVLHRFGLTRQVWLLDISRPALRGALAFFDAFGVMPFAVQGEIHGLPFKDRAFDLSLSGGLYEHFVGQEQEALVAENTRVSKRVLCQVPEDSMAYRIYRRLVEWHFGKWPFGFEVPVSRLRLRQLFSKAGGKIAREDYHNLASAVMMVAGERWAWARALAVRPFFFYFFRHDAVVAVERGSKRKP